MVEMLGRLEDGQRYCEWLAESVSWVEDPIKANDKFLVVNGIPYGVLDVEH